MANNFKVEWATQVTKALFTTGFLSVNSKVNDLWLTIFAVLSNSTSVAVIANSTSLPLANVTSVLQHYYICLENKTSVEAWSCFSPPQTAKPVACEPDDLVAVATNLMFMIGLLVLIGLSFGLLRKSCLTKCCSGRPGCTIPLNMLDSYQNRFGNALAFGATTTRCIFIVIGNNRALLGKEWAAYLDDPSTPSFISVFAKISITILVAIGYYPLFACMAYENKIVGSITGFIYTLLWILVAFWRFILVMDCLKSLRYAAFIFAYEIPGVFCLVLLLVKFVYMFQGAIRRWIQVRKNCCGGNLLLHEDVFSNWKEEYMYKHVCNLLKGPSVPGRSKLETMDIEEEKLKDKVKQKVYKFKPEFKYSTRIICAFAVASYAVYVMMVLLAFLWYVLVTEIGKVLIYSEEFAILLNRDANLIRTSREYFNVVHISFYVACGCAGLILVAIIMNMLSWYRGHIMRLRKGDKKWLPSSISQQNVSPASLTAASMKFAGFQVGYCVWATFFLTLILWVVFSLVGTQIVLPLIQWTWSPLLKLLYKYWPAIFLTLLINIMQFLVAKFVFLHDRGASFSINNRNAYHVTSYFLFFFNIALGIASCLLRIGYSVVFGVLFLARLQKSLLPRSYERKDPGYVAYVGYLFVEHTHANPVLCVFTRLLVEDSKVMVNIQHSESACSVHTLRPLSTKCGTSIPQNRRTLVRNRWHLAVTLLRNPSLKEFRVPTKGAVDQLVKGLARGLGSISV